MDVWYDLIGLGSRNASVIRASYVPVCMFNVSSFTRSSMLSVYFELTIVKNIAT